jgi:hypothetical protein
MKLQLEGDFAVEITDHAVIIRGSCPIDFWTAIAKVAEKEYGYDRMDYCMAGTLSATAVFTSKEDSKTMREEHDANIAHLQDWERWLSGWDVGLSSLTMFHAMKLEVYIPRYVRWWTIDKWCLPSDADDLGRCVRLLDALPELRADIDMVAFVYPEWKPILEKWDELEALYREGTEEANRKIGDLLSGLSG